MIGSIEMPPTFESTLDEVSNLLNGVKDIDEALLKTLKIKLDRILNSEDLALIGKELRSLEIKSINGNLAFPNLTASASPAELTVPAQQSNKSQNLEEAIILGLTDYLIKRTKQEAIFLFYEQVYQRVFAPSTFIKDTLFHHVSSLLEPLTPESNEFFEPDLVLIKESFNQDMDLLPGNLVKHPRARESDGLVALYYGSELIKNLTRGESLEKSFGNILKPGPDYKVGASPCERGGVGGGGGMVVLEKHNLAAVYNTNDPKQLAELSKLIAIWIANQYDDIHVLNDIDQIAAKIQNIYKDYLYVKKVIEEIQVEIKSIKPTGSFEEYQEYRRQLTLQILQKCTDLLISGVSVVEHFTNGDFGEVNDRIQNSSVTAKTAIESWFLILDKEYAQAAAHLIPMIPKVPAIQLDTTCGFLTKFKRLKGVASLASIKNDLKKLDDVLKNSSVDFNNFFYTSKTKDGALKFLTDYHLLFLEPLLLHDVSSVSLPSRLSGKEDLIAAYPKLNDLDNKIIAKILTVNEIETNYQDWRFLQSADHATFRADFVTGREWQIKLPGNMTIQDVITIYNDVIKKYENTITNIGNLYQDLKSKKIDGKDYDPVVKEHIALLLMRYFSIDGLDENLKKLISIAGEVSTANTAGDVERAFQKYALPVASYRIKRKERTSWMINAYLGAGPSYYKSEDDIEFTINAPIGLEFAKSFKSKRGSWSLFLPLLDVGNVVNYRIDEIKASGTGDDRSFKFENIVSPGAYVVFGLSKRFPFSWGIGYQTNPDRINTFLAFDLPLFRLK